MTVIRRRLRALAALGHQLAALGHEFAALGQELVALGHKAFRGGSRLYRVGTGRPPSSVRPARFIGATERFGAELRAIRQMQVSPELVSDIETELQWGLIWHDFERFMQAEIDRVFTPYLAIAECEDFEELRDLVGLANAEPQAEPRAEPRAERDAVLV